MDRQQHPASVHCTVNANQVEIVKEYLADLEASASEVLANPSLTKEGTAPMYGLMAKVPLRGFVKSSVLKVMEGMYGPTGDMPDLSNLGSGEDEGFLLRAINKYGDKALNAVDWLQKVRRSLFGGR